MSFICVSVAGGGETDIGNASKRGVSVSHMISTEGDRRPISLPTDLGWAVSAKPGELQVHDCGRTKPLSGDSPPPAVHYPLQVLSQCEMERSRVMAAWLPL